MNKDDNDNKAYELNMLMNLNSSASGSVGK